MSRRLRAGNCGETALRKRRRRADPMTVYDQLPAELRAWVREASLPWSPHSCLKIWRKAQRNGMEPPDILAYLDKVEAGTLTRA